MMNVTALSLLLFSLVTAGVWSPKPAQEATVKSEEPKVLLREGHRVIVVEYEREGVVDAAEKATHQGIGTAADSAKKTGENLRHAASQAREKVEEAGGKAVHVTRTGADKVEHAADQAAHVIRSGADKTKDAVKSTAGKAASVLHRPGTEKEGTIDETVPEHVENKPGSMYESAKESVYEAVDSVGDAAAGAKEGMKDRYQEAASLLPKLGQGIVNEETAESYGFYGDSNREPAEENSTVRSVGGYINQAEESLRDATQILTDAAAERREKIKSLKDEAKDTAFEKIKESGQGLSRSSQAVKDKASDVYDYAKGKVSDAGEKIKGSAEESYDSARSKVSGAGHKIKESAEQTYDSAKAKVSGAGHKIKEGAEQTLDSAKGKVSSAGQKIKEGAEQTFDSAKDKVSDAGEIFKETAGETYDSAEGKVLGARQKIKESAEHTYDSAKGKVSDATHKIKEKAGQAYDSAEDLTSHKEDSFEYDARDLRIQQALRHAGEAAIEKFRHAMDEAYRMSTNGAEKKFIPLLSEDAETNVDRAGARTGDLVKDAATNLTGGPSNGLRLMTSRIERLTSPTSFKVGARILHLLAFSTIYGSSVWVNLLAGHILVAAIPRQQFALIQSKMYPVYFYTMAYGLATCLLTHAVIHPWKPEAKIQSWQDYNLLISLLLTLVNMLILEPRTTKVIFEKLRVEKEEGRGTDVADMQDHLPHSPEGRNGNDVTKYRMVLVHRKLKLLHRLSSLINLVTLMGLSWHLVYLSSCIKT